jgi:hypothetical protein
MRVQSITTHQFDYLSSQIGASVNTATGRGWTKTAMALVGRQSASLAALVAERQQAAERLANLKVQQANSIHNVLV